MTAPLPPAPPAPPESPGQTVADPAPSPSTRGARAWSVSRRGVWTVAQLELRQRIRSTRWIVSLVVFAVVVAVVTFLTWAVADLGAGYSGESYIGRAMFGFIVFFVLFLGMLVSPTLSATAINGDRAAGTLATLQVTLLSAAEIVLGKLLASWLASLAFLAVSVPFIVVAFFFGGVPPLALVTTLTLLAVMLAIVCAIGLGWSALTARTAGSAVLTYVTVAGLSVLSLIVFGLSVPMVSGRETVQIYGEVEVFDEDYTYECELYEGERNVVHTERTWWLLAVNPFVIVADAMPTDGDDPFGVVDPMSGIKTGVRSAREGARAQPYDECWSDDDNRELAWDWDPDDKAPVWPWGLGADLLLGAGGVWLAVRRLHIPQGTLAKGTRVA